MSDDELAALVDRYGCGTKLKRAIMKRMEWRHHDTGPPRDDWFREWPVLSIRIEAALAAKAVKPAMRRK